MSARLGVSWPTRRNGWSDVSLYKGLRVFFADERTIDPEPIRRTAGLMQGCVFSVLMLLALMSVWACLVRRDHPSVKTGCVDDDRLRWCDDSITESSH